MANPPVAVQPRHSSGGSQSIERPAQVVQAPAGGERVKRLPPRRRAGPGQRAGGTEDEVSLVRLWRRTYLGHVSRRPPDGGRLRLGSARPGEYQQHEQGVCEGESRELCGGGDNDVRVPGPDRPGESRDGVPL